MTEIDNKFNRFMDDMLMGDCQLSDLLTSEIVGIHHLLDAELQRRTFERSNRRDTEQLHLDLAEYDNG